MCHFHYVLKMFQNVQTFFNMETIMMIMQKQLRLSQIIAIRRFCKNCYRPSREELRSKVTAGSQPAQGQLNVVTLSKQGQR